MLITTVAVGAIGWILLDEPDAVVAAESASGIVARVDGIPLTRDQVLASVSSQLDALDRRRAEILAEATRDRIDELLLDAEAAAQSLDREALLAREVDDRLHTVDAGRVAEYFEAHRAELGEELAAVEHEIRRTLRRADYVAALRGRHDVQVVDAVAR